MTYDEWKTTNPADEELGNGEEDCTCGRRRDKYCPVHGIDPDYARDEMRDRDI